MSHRRKFAGILRILRTGAAWQDRPARLGTNGTVSSRFQRWRRQASHA
ncbi:transposase [Methylobacterium sp. Gmos1]